MNSYVLIGSEDPFSASPGGGVHGLASSLADNGDDVTVYLVQNGVLACRASSSAAGDIAALAERADVLADDFSLRERGIAAGDVVAGVRVTGIDALVDAVTEEDRRVLWM